MQFQMKGVERVEKRFERIFNRITFSVVLLAVSIIIAGIMIGIGGSGYVDIEVYTLSITVLKVGLIIASFIIVGLILSILRSTRLK